MSFIVLEGLDGSGKSTQMGLLRDYLDEIGKPYRYLHFPRLEEGVYGKLIARFLRGEMGNIDEVDPYLVALIFAGDRSDAAGIIKTWIDEGQLVILDRYVYSNIAFQCAKMGSDEEKIALMDWILDLEYHYNMIPRPVINIFLDVPLEFVGSQLKTERKGEDRRYLKGEKDIHEESLQFQEKVRQVYISLDKHVNDVSILDCSDGQGNMRAPDVIFEMIKKHITAWL